jgi:hypothetical protein
MGPRTAAARQRVTVMSFGDIGRHVWLKKYVASGVPASALQCLK